MLTRLLCCRASNGVASCSISRALLTRYLPQTISASSRRNSTRVLLLARKPFNTVSKRLVSNRSSVCKQNAATIDNGSKKINLDLNTNVSNNVYLFKYENPKYFRWISFFGASQLLFWLCMSYTVYTYLPAWDPQHGPLLKYCSDNAVTLFFVGLAAIVGVSSSTLCWFFTARSVKYLILNKGGKDVTFVTYHSLKKTVNITVPIEMIKCDTSRKKHYMPIKVIGRKLYYILDSEGKFVNPDLFHHTIGQFRK